MKVTRIRLAHVRIPFRQPYITAAGVVDARESIIVRLDTDAGLSGIGESSLLPHEGSAASLLHELVETAGELTGATPREVIDRVPATPAWAGIELAAWDADSKGDARPLSRWMWANAADAVRVNALVTAAETDQAVEAALAAVRNGFRTVKLKVGIAASPEQEGARIRALREVLDESVGLRLDANGAWDEPTAEQVLRSLTGIGIEYIEQPLAPGNLPAMQRLRAVSPVPIALDEEITTPASVRGVIDAAAADVLILKPLALGGLQATYAVRGQAMRAGMETVITTSIDTGIGTAAALHIAAGTESRFASGLATAHLLESSLVTQLPEVENGSMLVPNRAGLGVELDEEAVRRYAIREWASSI